VAKLADVAWDPVTCGTLWTLYEAARAEEEKAKARWAGPAEVHRRDVMHQSAVNSRTR
jgi:hypothetical protein